MGLAERQRKEFTRFCADGRGAFDAGEEELPIQQEGWGLGQSVGAIREKFDSGFQDLAAGRLRLGTEGDDRDDE